MFYNQLVNKDMEHKIENQFKAISAINTHRKMWLMLSACVIAVIGFTIFDRDLLFQYNLMWILGILGITISVVWWYWVMRLINKLVHLRIEEMDVLAELCKEVKEIKQNIRENGLGKNI